jgi:hypothetical protein
MMGMVVDAVEPRLVADVMQYTIIAGQYKGAALLERLLLAEGILSIQAGDNPRIIEYKLLSMLGEEYMERILRGRVIDEQKVLDFISAAQNRTPPPESDKFNKTLAALDDRSFQTVIRACGITLPDWVYALMGGSGEAVEKYRKNVSHIAFMYLIEQWELYKHVRLENILKYQNDILTAIDRLVKKGEIKGII